MGNCVSQAGRKDLLGAFPSQVNGGHSFDDPEFFNVCVKKRNKFIPGRLKVTENEIIFCRSRCESISWPLHFLRRYGFTSAGIFFFESGRRCSSGEGLHTFQSDQAANIFQLVQSRIQDNANLGAAVRDARSRSVTGSIHSTHSSVSGLTPLSARIHPIQRYSSEGTNSVGDYLQPTYSSYHRPSSRVLHHRRLANLQAAKRPRSLAAPAGNTTAWPLFSSSFHPRNRENHPAFMGNIVSQHVVCRHPSLLASKSEGHSYVNVNPQLRSVTPLSHSCTSCCNSQNDFFITSVDQGNTVEARLSARHQPPPPYRSVSETNSPSCDRFFFERYVNLSEVNSVSISANERDTTPPQLDYASVNFANGDDATAVSARTGSSAGRSDVSAASNQPSINYAKIDLEKTQAVEVAANAVNKDNPRRRQFSNS